MTDGDKIFFLALIALNVVSEIIFCLLILKDETND